MINVINCRKSKLFTTHFDSLTCKTINWAALNSSDVWSVNFCSNGIFDWTERLVMTVNTIIVFGFSTVLDAIVDVAKSSVVVVVALVVVKAVVATAALPSPLQQYRIAWAVHFPPLHRAQATVGFDIDFYLTPAFPLKQTCFFAYLTPDRQTKLTYGTVSL